MSKQSTSFGLVISTNVVSFLRVIATKAVLKDLLFNEPLSEHDKSTLSEAELERSNKPFEIDIDLKSDTLPFPDDASHDYTSDFGFIITLRDDIKIISASDYQLSSDTTTFETSFYDLKRMAFGFKSKTDNIRLCNVNPVPEEAYDDEDYEGCWKLCVVAKRVKGVPSTISLAEFASVIQFCQELESDDRLYKHQSTDTSNNNNNNNINNNKKRKESNYDFTLSVTNITF